ncbi:MAG: glycoside hydrolase family 3 N-terminal domain-containing protein [Flavobacteriales bacterium]|nr:glycoside hydrolase family 3 N-terminal domain-containing protein [Flavobacteriales bacterium]
MFRHILLVIFFAISSLFTKNLFAQDNAVFLNENRQWADSIMLSLSEDERIAQLFMVAAYSNKGEKHRDEIEYLIRRYKIGGLMFLQGGPVRQAKLTNFYQSISKTPLMVAIDGEWGVSMRLDSCLRFPWQMTLGAVEDSSLIYQMGVEVARQCKMLGIHINFAPVVDVNSNPNNPIINNRSFGEDPHNVAKLGLAYMQGMQDNNVLACAKHFPGHGDTDTDSHHTLPVVNQLKYRLKEVELIPFQKMIDNGLGSVMVAHLSIPSLDPAKNSPVSLSSKVVNGLLKKEMGFTGLSITDALNMKGVSNFYSPGIVDVKALLAGNDVLLFAEDIPKAINEINNAIKSNLITQSEIDERCHKILMAKRWFGLDSYKPVDESAINDSIVLRKTELLNKKLIESSLTLLQNYDGLIPLKRLDTLKLASISIGADVEPFQQMLSNYASITHFSIPEKLSLSQKIELLNKLSEYNLVIASVHKSNANAWKPYKISKEIDMLLQAISLQSKIIVNLFANPYSINSFLRVRNFDGLILSYQNSDLSQKQTAQAIFGGIGINGKIPVSTKHFSLSSGLRTESIRMSFCMIEEVDIRSDLVVKIDSIVENAILEEATPGCQILIAKEGKVFFKKSYGYHTYDKKIKVKNSDVYDIASITKIASTVPLLMQMVDQEKLNLNDKLGQYLDLDFSNKEFLKIRDVLAHQAGLLPWIPFYKQTLYKDSTSSFMKLRDTLYSEKYSQEFPIEVARNIYLHYSYTDSILKQIVETDLLDNKNKYCYSDLGYYLLQEIIETNFSDDRKLNELSADFFYKKLGMENLGFNPLERLDSSRIIPTEMDFEFRSQVLNGYVHDMGAAMKGGVSGHAGLFSNSNDLAKLMQLFLQNGEYAQERYISEEVVNDFTKYQFPENDNRRGAGFDKARLKNQEGGPASDNASEFGFGHSGFTGTLAWADPESNLVYIFLSNRIHPDSSNKKLISMNVRTEIMNIIYESLHAR